MSASKSVDILERLENAGAGCCCYAINRNECGCGADWAEDCVLEAAMEIRQLRDENERLLADIQRLNNAASHRVDL
jgi:hypothetical protein